MFAFDANIMEEAIIFLYASYPMNDVTADFLSLSYSVGNTEAVKYCDDFSQLYRLSYDRVICYTCTSSQNIFMAMNPQHLWSKVLITKDNYLLVFKDDPPYTNNMYFLKVVSNI